VAAALERLPGVRRADVSLERGEARVQFEAERVTPEALVAAVNRLGFQASLLQVGDSRPPTLLIEGLNSGTDIERARKVLAAIAGVTQVRIDPKQGEVIVDFDASKTTAQRLMDALLAAGFKARLPN
jgi:copper chaperone CopZ